ncbi:MAG TPA: 16S rRNA (cytosine(1402)-N(4))-methyltransferase RsmH [Verrucomicrobiota bacterium]|nr:16S rRNA (cytosine(1402)-N(4))-methyltransferase RsmH [Verrucomicrobiota bacterium]HRZ34952.1 16S rRNA (cytosine(1402)-N(4))-methyltransferase RsmH [Candidatus Paceibacterota bacterium]HRZ54943.1 16S rRNA (cytosine(1402)-N(4))-methyltransferase RsmH [Candidatus Paceibacterota bacterium]
MADDYHQPVLLEEVMAAFEPQTGRVYVDGTIGGGGHAEALLERSSPAGRLLGCDLDPDAISAAAARLGRFAGRFEIRSGNFADLSGWIPAGSSDGVLLDLGVSSHQLDCAQRGFSFRLDGPLDMRLDPRRGDTAADLVNNWPVTELAQIFRDLGEERRAWRVARALEWERRRTPFQTTRQLADLVERVAPRGGQGIHPATRVFQALRMAVNDELGSLRRGLDAAWAVLRPGGRLAVISFHSGEDRVVKRFGQALAREYEVTGDADIPEWRRPRASLLAWVNRGPVAPSAAEVASNPRARSARLRVMEKLG